MHQNKLTDINKRFHLIQEISESLSMFSIQKLKNKNVQFVVLEVMLLTVSIITNDYKNPNQDYCELKITTKTIKTLQIITA